MISYRKIAEAETDLKGRFKTESLYKSLACQMSLKYIVNFSLLWSDSRETTFATTDGVVCSALGEFALQIQVTTADGEKKRFILIERNFLSPLVKEYYPIYDRLYHQKRGFHYCPEIEDDNGRKAIENKQPLQRFPLGAYPVAPAILYAPTKNPWDGRIYMRKTQFVLTKENLSSYTVVAGQFKIRFSRDFLQWLWQMNKDLKRVAVFTDHPGDLPEKLFDY